MINPLTPATESLESLFTALPIDLGTDLSTTEAIPQPLFTEVLTAQLETTQGQEDAAQDINLPVIDEINIDNTIKDIEEVVAEVIITTEQINTEAQSENNTDTEFKRPLIETETTPQDELSYAVMMMMLQNSPVVKETVVETTSENTEVTMSETVTNIMQEANSLPKETIHGPDFEQEIVTNDTKLPQQTSLTQETSVKQESQIKIPKNDSNQTSTNPNFPELTLKLNTETEEIFNPKVTASLMEATDNSSESDSQEFTNTLLTQNTVDKKPVQENAVSQPVKQTVDNQIVFEPIPVEQKMQPSFNAKSISSDINTPTISTKKNISKEGTLASIPQIVITAPIDTQSIDPSQPVNKENFTPTIAAPLDSAEWGDEVSEKINFMLSHKQQVANIQLDPPELGPLLVKISMQGDAASIFFNSEHQEVRKAIEQAMPQLNEMLKENGVHLAQVEVGVNLAQSDSFNDQKQNIPSLVIRPEIAADKKEDVIVSRKNLFDGLLDVFV